MPDSQALSGILMPCYGTGCNRLSVFSFLKAIFVVARVEGVEVLAVELIGQQSQVLAEALVVYDLARPEEADRVDDVGIITEAQDIVVSGARLLLPRSIETPHRIRDRSI